MSLACTGCGAPLDRPDPSVKTLYCEYCGQALVVLPDGFDPKGRAALAETPTIVKVGDRATILGTPYRVAGRVQYRFEDGLYDHFFLAAEAPAWLEQDEGELRLFTKVESVEAPGWDDLGIGSPVELAGGSFYPMEFGEGAVNGGAGALPMLLTPGAPFKYVDGTWNGESASLDYTVAGTFLMTGRSLEASDVAVARRDGERGGGGTA